MLWLSRRPEWQRSREFETTTRTALPGGSSNSSSTSSSTYRSAEDDDWDQWEVAVSGNIPNSGGEVGEDGEGRPKTRVVFQPTYDTTHTIFYKGHWLRVRRGRKQETGSEMLSIRLFLYSLQIYISSLSNRSSHQCRRTVKRHPQTTSPSSKERIRSRSRPSHPNLFRRCSWFLALDRFKA